MSDKIQMTRTISIGNLLQIGAMVVAVVGGYFALEAKTSENAGRLQRLEDAHLKTVERGERRDRRIQGLETSQARDDERLSNILTLLARIDGRLERIEGRQGR